MQDAEEKPKRGKLYREEFCDQVIDWGKEGQTPAEWAAEIGVATGTLWTWRRRYPEFNEAFEIGVTAFRAWLERKACEGLSAGRQFNAAVFMALAKAYARQAYAESQPPTADGAGVPNEEALGSMTVEELDAKEREILDRQNALRAAIADAKARARDET